MSVAVKGGGEYVFGDCRILDELTVDGNVVIAGSITFTGALAVTLSGGANTAITTTVTASEAYTGWALGFFGSTQLTSTSGVIGSAAGGVFEVNMTSAFKGSTSGIIAGAFVGAYCNTTDGELPTAGLWLETIAGTGVSFQASGAASDMPMIALVTSGAGTKSSLAIEFGSEVAAKTVTTTSGGMFYNATIQMKANGTLIYMPTSTVEGTYTTAYLIQSSLATDSSSTVSGAVIIAGGVGIAKTLYVGTGADITGSLAVDGATVLLDGSTSVRGVSAAFVSSEAPNVRIGADASWYMDIAVTATTGVTAITHTGGGPTVTWTADSFDFVGTMALDATNISDTVTITYGAGATTLEQAIDIDMTSATVEANNYGIDLDVTHGSIIVDTYLSRGNLQGIRSDCAAIGTIDHVYAGRFGASIAMTADSETNQFYGGIFSASASGAHTLTLHDGLVGFQSTVTVDSGVTDVTGGLVTAGFFNSQPIGKDVTSPTYTVYLKSGGYTDFGQSIQVESSSLTAAFRIQAIDSFTLPIGIQLSTAGTGAITTDIELSNGGLIHNTSADLISITEAEVSISAKLSVGVDAAAGTIELYPGTTNTGTTTVTMADNAGDTITNINVAEQAGARTYTVPDAGADAAFLMTDSYKTWWPFAIGLAGEDTDGAATNGCGMAGGVVDLTTHTYNTGAYGAADVMCLAYDHGTTTWEDLKASSSLTGWTDDYQFQPDAGSEEANDAFAIGMTTRFCEIAFTDLSTGSGAVATYSDPAGKWTYSTGAGTWSDLTVFDNTSTGATTGTKPLQRIGAVSFAPPANWASATYDVDKTGYWIRWVCTAAEITACGVAGAVTVPCAVIPNADAFDTPFKATIGEVRATDMGITVHDAAIKFVVGNFTTGIFSQELEWAASQYNDTFTPTTPIPVAADDIVGICITDDAASSVNPVIQLELEATYLN